MGGDILRIQTAGRSGCPGRRTSGFAAALGIAGATVMVRILGAVPAARHTTGLRPRAGEGGAGGDNDQHQKKLYNFEAARFHMILMFNYVRHDCQT